MDSAQSLSLTLNAESIGTDEAPNNYQSSKVGNKNHIVSPNFYDPRDVQLMIERTLPCNCPNAGFLRTKVTRLENEGHQRQYLMSLQLDKDEHPLFVAEKESSSLASLTVTGSRWTIRKFNDDSVHGTLMKVGSAQHSNITYTLSYILSDTNVAYIRYEVPSVMKVLANRPPRRAMIELPGRGYAETKEPSFIDGKMTVDFHGRGREASCKNMQLQRRDGKVLLQFVKWDKQTFHLDFRKPFDAFPAFGFALAQFDL